MSDPIPQTRDWSLRDLKDTRAGMIEQVQAAAFVPDQCKAMLVEAIELFDPKANLLRLNCHAHVGGKDKRPSLEYIISLTAL
jgi:hypothetical protein